MGISTFETCVQLYAVDDECVMPEYLYQQAKKQSGHGVYHQENT